MKTRTKIRLLAMNKADQEKRLDALNNPTELTEYGHEEVEEREWLEKKLGCAKQLNTQKELMREAALETCPSSEGLCSSPHPYVQLTTSSRPDEQERLVASDFADAKAYAKSYLGNGSGARFFSARLRQICMLFDSANRGRALDVGCGPGILLSKISEMQFDAYGIDRSASMIAEAREVAPLAHLTVGRAEKLPFPDNYFDIVVLAGILEYLPKPEDALNEVYRVAKPGSLIIVSMLNGRAFRYQWDKTVGRLWRAFRRRWRTELPATYWLRRLPQSRSHLYRLNETSLRKLLAGCHLHPDKTIFYDLNIVPTPFDARNQASPAAVNVFLESHLGERFAILTHTGFLVVAYK